MLMNNIGENIHKQVIDIGVLPILVKIVKKKSDLPVRERIFLLLNATQTSLGGASGKFPQYYTAYNDLVQAGVQFPQRPSSTPPVVVTAHAVPRNTLNEQLASARNEGTAPPTQQRESPTPSSILQKASAALEVLKEVLDAVDDSHNPEGAKDEFTLDLVEQCSFQKERVMHLVMTSRQRILNRHEDLLSGRITGPGRSAASNGYHSNHEPSRPATNGSNANTKSSSSISNPNHLNLEDEDEEEEPEQLFRRHAKDVIKAIKKRLGSKNPNTQLYTVQLLEMLMNNIGENIHKQVIDIGVLPILVKIVKKKSDLPVRERIFLLLNATQTSLGGASGKFPQYYTVYNDLVTAGVQFPQRPSSTPPVVVTAQAVPRNTLNEQLASARNEGTAPPTQQRESHTASPSSILQKASAALEVLKEVLDAVDSQNPEGAKDEFTLDLVEQCSFQKERVMHLVMTSRQVFCLSCF
ncbi:hypothetical protein F2Q70_00010937 [Brassica cretica]|uniref:VHS domain-containing protein n=1 Tax=Brassica cretica TaxID=69181 RepID=A0A8S9M8Q3_BRACR|nr:hypothetical protein F2Q70_00010937 [Brassica cretica]